LKQIDPEPIFDDREDAQRERRRRKRRQEQMDALGEEADVSPKQQSELLLRAVRKKQLEEAKIKERDERIQSEIMAAQASSGLTPSYKDTASRTTSELRAADPNLISEEEYKKQLAALSDNVEVLQGKFDFEEDTQV